MKKAIVIMACCLCYMVSVAKAETQEELMDTLKKIDIAGIVNDSFDVGAKCGIELMKEKFQRTMSNDETMKMIEACRSKAQDQIVQKLSKIISSQKK